ncbi:MAG TPA: DoxX family protein [Marmoricola sp.]|nr:DoxX family protein [Marmoricola sp.]
MEIAYWIIAGLLAALYVFAGSKKLTGSQESLQPMMAWAGTTVPMPGVRAIGLVELLGAVGLILPPAIGVAPVLALAAAAGFLVLQILALRLHLSLGESLRESTINVVLIVGAAAAIWLSTTWL